MEKPQPSVLPDLAAPDFEPEQMGARFWYEQYLNQREENQRLRQQLSQLQAEVEQLKEALRKLNCFF
jgi:transposase